jgi:hypothetical protein
MSILSFYLNFILKLFLPVLQDVFEAAKLIGLYWDSSHVI